MQKKRLRSTLKHWKQGASANDTFYIGLFIALFVYTFIYVPAYAYLVHNAVILLGVAKTIFPYNKTYNGVYAYSPINYVTTSAEEIKDNYEFVLGFFRDTVIRIQQRFWVQPPEWDKYGRYTRYISEAELEYIQYFKELEDNDEDPEVHEDENLAWFTKPDWRLIRWQAWSDTKVYRIIVKELGFRYIYNGLLEVKDVLKEEFSFNFALPKITGQQLHAITTGMKLDRHRRRLYSRYKRRITFAYIIYYVLGSINRHVLMSPHGFLWTLRGIIRFICEWFVMYLDEVWESVLMHGYIIYVFYTTKSNLIYVSRLWKGNDDENRGNLWPYWCEEDMMMYYILAWALYLIFCILSPTVFYDDAILRARFAETEFNYEDQWDEEEEEEIEELEEAELVETVHMILIEDAYRDKGYVRMFTLDEEEKFGAAIESATTDALYDYMGPPYEGYNMFYRVDRRIYEQYEFIKHVHFNGLFPTFLNTYDMYYYIVFEDIMQGKHWWDYTGQKLRREEANMSILGTNAMKSYGKPDYLLRFTLAWDIPTEDSTPTYLIKLRAEYEGSMSLAIQLVGDEPYAEWDPEEQRMVRMDRPSWKLGVFDEERKLNYDEIYAVVYDDDEVAEEAAGMDEATDSDDDVTTDDELDSDDDVGTGDDSGDDDDESSYNAPDSEEDEEVTIPDEIKSRVFRRVDLYNQEARASYITQNYINMELTRHETRILNNQKRDFDISNLDLSFDQLTRKKQVGNLYKLIQKYPQKSFKELLFLVYKEFKKSSMEPLVNFNNSDDITPIYRPGHNNAARAREHLVYYTGHFDDYNDPRKNFGNVSTTFISMRHISHISTDGAFSPLHDLLLLYLILRDYAQEQQIIHKTLAPYCSGVNLEEVIKKRLVRKICSEYEKYNKIC